MCETFPNSESPFSQPDPIAPDPIAHALLEIAHELRRIADLVEGKTIKRLPTRNRANNTEPIPVKILNKPIDELEISVRLYNCLNKEEITTIEGIISHTPAELLRIQNFGRSTLQELREVLSVFGIDYAWPKDR